MFSIIIPVLHETEIINLLLESLKDITKDYSAEIIIVDGSPTQDTLAVITDTSVQKLHSIQGRAVQMNTGAAHATGEILVFLHADTFLPPNALSKIQNCLQNPDIVGGAFTSQPNSRNRFIQAIYKTSMLRAHITRAPYGDQVIFLRKTFFDTLGGYANLPLMEDVELMRRVKKKGGRIMILPDIALTSARRWTQEGILYSWLRDNYIIFLYWCGVPAQKLEQFYPWLGNSIPRKKNEKNKINQVHNP
jgi:rSAM/selenodomain-associated transferase 2